MNPQSELKALLTKLDVAWSAVPGPDEAGHDDVGRTSWLARREQALESAEDALQAFRTRWSSASAETRAILQPTLDSVLTRARAAVQSCAAVEASWGQEIQRTRGEAARAHYARTALDAYGKPGSGLRR